MSLRFPLLSSGLLAAQSIERPTRAVTDPGVVTTRQSITPAWIPSVFPGRVYGVQFRSATEMQVLTGVGVYRMDWRQNKVPRHTAARGRGGIQAIDGDDPVWLFQRENKVWPHRGNDTRGTGIAPAGLAVDAKGRIADVGNWGGLAGHPVTEPRPSGSRCVSSVSLQYPA